MRILFAALAVAGFGSGCVVVQPASCGPDGATCGPSCPTLCHTVGSPLSYNQSVTATGGNVYSADPGVGTVIGGNGAGFGLTAGGTGSWRLVWTNTGDSAFNEFYGSVWTPGAFTSTSSGCSGECTALSGNDSVSSGAATDGASHRLDFDSIAATQTVGFDFSVDTEPIYLDLYINGTYYSGNVWFTSGGVVANPGTVPFAIQSP